MGYRSERVRGPTLSLALRVGAGAAARNIGRGGVAPSGKLGREFRQLGGIYGWFEYNCPVLPREVPV